MNIKQRLRSLLESYRVLPQDPNAEINAVPNPFQKHTRTLDTQELGRVQAQNAMAKQVSLEFRKAFKNNEEGFETIYKGQKLHGRIPPQFRINPHNINYFDDPTMGDGAMQARLDKTGYIQIKNLQATPKMATAPNLSSAADAGNYYDYQGTLRYFRLKVGFLGKYQDETRSYSIFTTPAIDAEIKTRVSFDKEIIYFLSKTSYVDNKASDIAHQMPLETKIEKIRKDAENELGRPISSNKVWMDFKNHLLKAYGTPNAVFDINMPQETQDFIKLFKAKNVFTPPKAALSMSPDELADFEKRQKDIQARLAARKR